MKPPKGWYRLRTGTRLRDGDRVLDVDDDIDFDIEVLGTRLERVERGDFVIRRRKPARRGRYAE